jgi:hypothetical protein
MVSILAIISFLSYYLVFVSPRSDLRSRRKPGKSCGVSSARQFEFAIASLDEAVHRSLQGCNDLLMVSSSFVPCEAWRKWSPLRRSVTQPSARVTRCRTRRGGATRRPSRCAPWGRGRATGTCPKGRPVRAHSGIGVVDDAVLERERAHARPIAMVRGRVGSAHGRELGLRPLAATLLTRAPLKHVRSTSRPPSALPTRFSMRLGDCWS